MIEIAEYRNYLIDNEIALQTRKNYLNTLKQLSCFLKDNNLELTKESTIRFKEWLRETEYAKGRKYKITTINQKINAINIYFNWRDQRQYGLKTVKTQIKGHRPSVDTGEYKKMLKAANNDDEMRLFMMTIANTGVRITELCSLQSDDLDSKMQQIENKGKIRIISIPVWLKKQLKTFCRTNGITGTIFYKTQSSYRERLKRIAGKAKVNKEKVYPHSFRHYFAKEFIRNGGDSTELQQMLGHENISTTTIYTKLSNSELANRFAGIKNK